MLRAGGQAGHNILVEQDLALRVWAVNEDDEERLIEYSPLPDPKPPVPIFTAEGQKVLAGAAAMSFLPVRKPSASEPEALQAAAAEQEPAGDADEVATSGDTDESEPGPSQTVADSDKTAPSETKATQ